MSGAIFEYLNGGVEYELRCDGCGAVFKCRDDSYFSWAVLCSAAEAEGWRVQPGFDGEHECRRCASAASRDGGGLVSARAA